MELVTLKESFGLKKFEPEYTDPVTNYVPSFKDISNNNGREKLQKKCGEIFIDESYLFNFMCTFCENDFVEIENFFAHIKNNHSIKYDAKLYNDPLDMNDIDNNILQNVKLESNNQEIVNDSNVDLNLCETEIPIMQNNDEKVPTQSPNKELNKVITRKGGKLSTEKAHKRVRSKKDIFCDICNRGFTTETALSRHKKYDHVYPDPFLEETIENYKPDPLTDDDSNTEKKELDISSQQSNLSTCDPSQCRYCDRRFANNRNRIEHERIHTGETPYKCNFCGKSFRTKSYCTRHQIIHNGIKQYKCDKCNMAFITKSYLSVHMRRHGEKKYPCKYCGKLFYENSDKNQHERIHTGEKPYQCVTCGQCFLTSGRLTKHNVKHTGIKAFKCQYCDMCFYSKSLLNEHNIKHTTDRPFVCTICKATFPRRKSLKSHEKIHSDFTTYNCIICAKGFKQYPGLYCHMKSHGQILTRS